MQTIPDKEIEPQPTALPLNATIWGYLRAVDWTHMTGRLEPYAAKPIPLKFADGLAEDMHHYTNKYVLIRGKGVLDEVADEWLSVKVETIEADRNMHKPFDMEEFNARPRKPFKIGDLKPASEPFDVDEFIRSIRESRRRREA